MVKIFNQILNKLGIDSAIRYFLIGKIFSFISAPVTIYLITSYFTPTIQGYYYTINSLLSLSIFFELGLGVVITQFASHEFAKLNWNNKKLEGEQSSLMRLISLTRKSLKWYSVICGLFILIGIPVGLFFLNSKQINNDMNFVLTWILTVIFSSAGTAIIPLTSVLEGCGSVAQVQQLRVLQAFGRNIFLWVAILLGLRLIVVSIEFFAILLVFIVWLFYNYKDFILQLFYLPLDKNITISWKREILPLQSKVALSWIAAYFINYLFLPLLFTYRGPIEAGKMGVSMRVSEIVFLISIAWINTKAPKYGSLINQKKYSELNKLALSSTIQAVIVGTICSIGAVLVIFILNIYKPDYGSRFLDYGIIAILCLSSLLNVVLSSIGSYLRAYKKEPMMILSIILAVFISVSNYLCSKYLDTNKMAISYALILLLVGLPFSLLILMKKKKEYQLANLKFSITDIMQ